MRSASILLPAARVLPAPARNTVSASAGRNGANKLSVVPKAAVQDAILSSHPDAIRRRRAAEARQEDRHHESAETQRSLRGESTVDMPSNMLEVHQPQEMDSRIQSYSSNGELVLVHFKGTWCVACARMQYTVKKIAKTMPDVVFIVVDLSNERLMEHCRRLGVENIPYFHLYKDNELVSRFSCNLETIQTLRRELQAHRKEAPPPPEWANVVTAPAV